jgi:hypothetical protein
MIPATSIDMRVVLELKALADRRDRANSRGNWPDVQACEFAIKSVILIYAVDPADRERLEDLTRPPPREPRRRPVKRAAKSRACEVDFAAAATPPAGEGER